MSAKQDRVMPRTAVQLERKYKLSEMRKAFNVSTTVTTRINQIQEDFVNTIISTIDSFAGLEDGVLETHYGHGEPELVFDKPENHVNDLYYDRDSGKGYVYSENFEWMLIENQDKIQVLALANATIYTQDDLRRIFVSEPIPPYDNGDLWLRDGVIYSCQISKTNTEVYENHDFIVSSYYDGDMLALKTANALGVLRGGLQNAINDIGQIKNDLSLFKEETVKEREKIVKSVSGVQEELKTLKDTVEALEEQTSGATLLWSGNDLATETFSLDLTDSPISEMKQGLVFIFGRDGDNNISSHFVPKEAVSDIGSTSHAFALCSSVFDYIGTKTLYLSDDLIEGCADNSATGTNTTSGITYHNEAFYLRYVFEI